MAVARLVADARCASSCLRRWPASDRTRRPDTPGVHIEAALNPIAYRCACVPCSQAVTARIQAVLQEWAAVKVRGCAHADARSQRPARRERSEDALEIWRPLLIGRSGVPSLRDDVLVQHVRVVVKAASRWEMTSLEHSECFLKLSKSMRASETGQRCEKHQIVFLTEAHSTRSVSMRSFSAARQSVHQR